MHAIDGVVNELNENIDNAKFAYRVVQTSNNAGLTAYEPKISDLGAGLSMWYQGVKVPSSEQVLPALKAGYTAVETARAIKGGLTTLAQAFPHERGPLNPNSKFS